MEEETPSILCFTDSIMKMYIDRLMFELRKKDHSTLKQTEAMSHQKSNNPKKRMISSDFKTQNFDYPFLVTFTNDVQPLFSV